jgi:hypothetical protein
LTSNESETMINQVMYHERFSSSWERMILW